MPHPSFPPFAFSVDNCVETVDLTGTFYEVAGTGVWRLTGNHYQWNDRLFGQGTAPDQQLSTQIKFTVNAQVR